MPRVAARLDAIAEETETGWQGRYGNDGYLFTREVRGVTEAHALDRSLLVSIDARRLNERRAELVEVYTARANRLAPNRRADLIAAAHRLGFQAS